MRHAFTSFRGTHFIDPKAPHADGGLKISLCETTEEKQKAADFAFRIVQTPRYGLNDDTLYKQEFGKVDRIEYLQAREIATNELIGDFQIRFDYDPRHSDSLTTDSRTFCKQKPIIDLGAHIARPTGQRMSVYIRLWAYLMRILRKAAFDGALYGQIRPFVLEEFISLGWNRCSSDFHVLGWQHEWLALWMRTDLVPEKWNSPEFQQSWAKDTGVRLNTRFWNSVERIIATPEYWKE
jgi:hypothetical protein